MLLVIDVGNTNMVIGVYEGEKLVQHWRIMTNHDKTEDEYGITFKHLLADKGISFDQISDVIISSVVPPIMTALELMVEKYLGLEATVINSATPTGLKIKIDNPREIGADRIVNAVAGIAEYGTPLIIVDFGTATTFCAINKAGEYLGGAIAPGIQISTEALFDWAAKLPRIELIKPAKSIGTNTVEAMQSGIIYGYIGQLDGMVRRMKREVGGEATKVIVTGGLAKLIAGETGIVDVVDEFLTLKGLRLIHSQNQ